MGKGIKEYESENTHSIKLSPYQQYYTLRNPKNTLAKHRSKVTVSEMEYLRRAVGKTNKDTYPRRTGTVTLVGTIGTQQAQLFGHMIRMNR